MTDAFGWRSTMALLAGVAVLVLAAAPGLLTESRHPSRPRVDVPGAVTVTGGLLALIYALSTAAKHGFGGADVITTLVLGPALLAAFVVIESRTAEPMVSLTMLRRRSVAFGNLAGLATFAMMSSVIFLLTLYLQKVLGFSPLAAGLSFGVLGLGTVTGGSFAPRIIARVGTRATLIGGGVVQAASTFALLGLTTSTSGSLTLLLISTFTGGVGNMLVIVGFMITATSGLPDAEQGLATGLATMIQQIGITLGTPIMSAIVTAHTGSLLGGISTAVATNAALVAAGALASALFLGRRTP